MNKGERISLRKDININLNNKNGQNIKKKKERKEQIEKNNEAGITIITLAITILIIIILASITINAVLGDNGLLKQAQDAKDLAESTTLETGEKMNKVLQEYMNVMAEDGGGIEEPEEDTTPPTVIITEGEITENSIEINVTADDPESGLASEDAYVYYLNGLMQTRSSSSRYTFSGLTASTPYTIKVEVYNGAGIKGEDSITISTSAKPGLSAEEISQNPTTYYGAEVIGYTCESDGVSKWRIFYADESNIYLIADDYIAAEDAPKGQGGTSVIANTTYRISLNNMGEDYTGANWINQNSKAKKWLTQYLSKYSTSTIYNIKFTAYLMDTNIWNKYVGKNAEYAIGGPTIELFCASYKDTHSTKYIEYSVTNSDGYSIKWNTDSSYSTDINGLEQNLFNEIYLKSEQTRADAMWIASPSSYDNTLLLNVYYNGILDANGNYYDWKAGLRPIVCLKTEVKLEAQGDGTYAIVE